MHAKPAALLSLLLVAALTTAVPAATLRVPGDYATIQAGLAAAASGDTVEIACGTYTEHSLIVPSGITLRSATGSSECATIDGQSLGPVLLCTNLAIAPSIVGLTITGGEASGDYPLNCGGGIRCVNSSPFISRCRFVANHAGEGGAAVACFGSSAPAIDGSLFEFNAASGGAGVWSDDGSYPTITTSTFASNVASSGCAVWAYGVTLVDCLFTDNRGGGRNLGAVCVSRSRNPVREAVLTPCTFSNNYSDGYGGALTVYEVASPSVSVCQFLGNHAVEGGGAVFYEQTDATFSDCHFVGNSANRGGAVFGQNTAAPAFTACRFESNSATQGGAVFHDGNSAPVFIACRFESNSATRGGALLFGGTASPTLAECHVVNNSGDIGGGAYVLDSSTPLFSGTRFELNRGGYYGGAIAGRGQSAAAAEDCVFFNNSSVYHGGALAVWEKSARLSLVRSTLVGNRSDYGNGGAIYCWEAACTVDNSIIAFGGRGSPVYGCAALACTDIFGNADGDWIQCIAPQEGTNGNFSADPLFCDLGGGNLAIRTDSPCAPANSDGCGLVGALPEGCGPIGVAALSWARLKAMYRD